MVFAHARMELATLRESEYVRTFSSLPHPPPPLPPSPHGSLLFTLASLRWNSAGDCAGTKRARGVCLRQIQAAGGGGSADRANPGFKVPLKLKVPITANYPSTKKHSAHKELAGQREKKNKLCNGINFSLL